MGRWKREKVAHVKGREDVKCRCIYKRPRSDHLWRCNDIRDEDGRVNVDKSDEGREYIGMYVLEHVVRCLCCAKAGPT